MDKVNVYKDSSGAWRWERRTVFRQIVAKSNKSYSAVDVCINKAKELNSDCQIFVLGQPIVEVQR